MFYVESISGYDRGKRYKVYDVRDNGVDYPDFLICKGLDWFYTSAKYFTPVEENTYEEY